MNGTIHLCLSILSSLTLFIITFRVRIASEGSKEARSLASGKKQWREQVPLTGRDLEQEQSHGGEGQTGKQVTNNKNDSIVVYFAL